MVAKRIRLDAELVRRKMCDSRERARDHVESDTHPEAVTASLEAEDRTAGEFKRVGPVV